MDQTQLAAFRAFNRFHTRLVGALNEHLLQSEFSLPQMRVLYELAQVEGASARDLGAALRMDPGYFSRVLTGLEAAGLVSKTPGRGKRLALGLTDRGRQVFAGLDAASAAEVAGLLDPLSEGERREMTGAMAVIRRVLGDLPPPEVVLRAPEAGEFGAVVQAQALLYAREYGWNAEFEALLAEIVAQFIRGYDPKGERAWVAAVEGRIVGSVFVVRQDAVTAKLRLLYVDASVRGQGLGRRLVREAMGFAQGAGYSRMVLWTNDILTAARKIYESEGFVLIGEDRHHSFGQDLVGQTWERDL